MNAIVVSATARRWLAEQGGVLTLRTANRNGCCGGRAAVPVAEARVPDDPSQYRCHHVEGLKMLVAPELEGVAMVVDLDGIGRWRRLCVEAEIRPATDAAGET